MASLDVLDYQLALEQALAKEGLPPGLRRQAVKEARRTLDAMAFRFAIMDERPLPEDLDYLRALEAMKPVERAAPVLARRRPLYAANRRRRLVTTWGVLLVIAAAIGGLAYLATSEVAEELVLVDHNVQASVTFPEQRNFTVTDDMTRLHIDGTFLVNRNSRGIVELRLIDPSNRTRVAETYVAGGNIYLRENIYDPEPGQWTLLVDFLDAQGAVRVTVDGIRPAR